MIDAPPKFQKKRGNISNEQETNKENLSLALDEAGSKENGEKVRRKTKKKGAKLR